MNEPGLRYEMVSLRHGGMDVATYYGVRVTHLATGLSVTTNCVPPPSRARIDEARDRLLEMVAQHEQERTDR